MGIEMKRIHVVAAVIVNADQQQIFISRRADHLHQGGFWEFPGGKVETGESAESALARELFEELDIRVEAAEPYMQVEHDYPDKQVFLDIWQVNRFAGKAHGKEGQECRWVGLQELLTEKPERLFHFPAANQPILEQLAKTGISA
jgi:8-oxo-dGTP diphosphatase